MSRSLCTRRSGPHPGGQATCDASSHRVSERHAYTLPMECCFSCINSIPSNYFGDARTMQILPAKSIPLLPARPCSAAGPRPAQ